MTNFYDKLAKKFGGYGFAHDGLEYRSVYPNGNPEQEFYDAVKIVSGLDRKALDIGCGDGIFSFRVADSFARIDGIDNSKELIKIAVKKQGELGVKMTYFVFDDASAMLYDDESFDVAFNRRGPSFYDEYARVLKPQGTYIEIGIGEQDTRSLKEVFGRGQGFGQWTTRRIDRDKLLFAASGLSIIRAEDYFYKELYPSREMFGKFLEGVPIFEDFDPIKDANLLDAYYSTHTTENGEVELTRHRVLYVLQKQ
jgi:SAM-dependent methyltransferase